MIMVECKKIILIDGEFVITPNEKCNINHMNVLGFVADMVYYSDTLSDKEAVEYYKELLMGRYNSILQSTLKCIAELNKAVLKE